MDATHSDIAIIGAGMAGLACAVQLAAAGRDVRVFDKGRGPGGRMAARRADVAGETVRFDHGAQYFTAREPAFREAVAAWEAQGVVARWPAAQTSSSDAAWVGVPGMNGPIKAMADTVAQAGREVLWNTR
ncbi:MAG: FAD-dependent oxidoreductase, partial [Pseudomonadota bacterium]